MNFFSFFLWNWLMQLVHIVLVIKDHHCILLMWARFTELRSKSIFSTHCEWMCMVARWENVEYYLELQSDVSLRIMCDFRHHNWKEKCGFMPASTILPTLCVHQAILRSWEKKCAFALQAFPALVTEYVMPLEINTATVIAVPVPFYYGNIQRATIPCIIQTSVIFWRFVVVTTGMKHRTCWIKTAILAGWWHDLWINLKRARGRR